MKKVLLVVICMVSIGLAPKGFAQKKVGGEVALGARFGGTTAMTLKRYSGYNTSAIEVLAGWNFDEPIDGFDVSAMWEKLAPLTNSKKLSAEFGFGATMIFGDEFYFGPSGIIGLDWRLKSVPVTMSIDWMPTWIVVNANRFSSVNGAFSVRWVLNHKQYK
jgi:hypothetical protein